MRFSYSQHMQKTFPGRVSGVIQIHCINDSVTIDEALARFTSIASDRLARSSEGEFPEIKAWRKAFSTMGLKPTKYRCASEALLRRFRKEEKLPRINPLIDLCNAASIAFAIPIAVFDQNKISGNLTVRQAAGDENYMSFRGEIEHPEIDEIIFSDDEAHAHARRWANRQSSHSAVSAQTTRALIIAEALHDDAEHDMAQLVSELSDALKVTYKTDTTNALLVKSGAIFDSSSEAI